MWTQDPSDGEQAKQWGYATLFSMLLGVSIFLFLKI